MILKRFLKLITLIILVIPVTLVYTFIMGVIVPSIAIYLYVIKGNEDAVRDAMDIMSVPLEKLEGIFE